MFSSIRVKQNEKERENNRIGVNLYFWFNISFLYLTYK
jgi:hypothetical protein